MENTHNHFLKRIQRLKRNRGQTLFSEVYSIFEKVYQKMYPQNEYETQLMEILKTFQVKGELQFPKDERFWDMTKTIPLPLWIKFPSQKKKIYHTPWKNEIWIPQLSWIVKINRMSPTTYRDLQKINEFVKSTKSDLLFPEKERSIQLFGNEKRLRELQAKYGKKIDLFGLTLSYKTHNPLTYREFSTSHMNAIILENRDTFDSFCRINKDFNPSKYRYIIYGNGINILENYCDILKFETIPNSIEYFGDLDPSGLYIGQQLQKQMKNNGCFLILEYDPYYKRLLEIYSSQEWNFNLKPQNNPYSLDFIPEQERKLINRLFQNKMRIPQELLNIYELTKIFNKL